MSKKTYLLTVKLNNAITNLENISSTGLEEEIIEVLGTDVKIHDYLCVCCETDLCGDLTELCSMCFEYKEAQGLLKDILAKEVLVVIETDSDIVKAKYEPLMKDMVIVQNITVETEIK